MGVGPLCFYIKEGPYKLGERSPFSLPLTNCLGNTKGKDSPGIAHGKDNDFYP